MDFAFPPSPIPTLTIHGSASVFPQRRIYCIGRNFAAHAIEMGHDPERENPFFFQKNPNNADQSGKFPYPEHSNDVHFELELAVALHSGGRNIPVSDANSHVFGYAVSLDMTRRDLQGEMKKAGRPWDIGKAFERSAPMSPIVRKPDVGELTYGSMELFLNGKIQQSGDLNQMIWKIPEMISYLSEYFELAAGDIIMSGTPAGVGSVQRGDNLVANISNLPPLKVEVI
jgi:fumarylpyruvate hydrolase